jgi:hypothetical protein
VVGSGVGGVARDGDLVLLNDIDILGDLEL